jgi:nucleoside-diphosphate-sugar epimerase
MIIGNGLLANTFRPFYEHDPDVLVFASGVSNSRETRLEAFAREKSLLQDACQLGKELVYFSTCSVHDPELAHSPYVRHKLEMEAIVTALPHFSVLRLPQVVGHTPNPHTLTNFLHQKIKSGEKFHIWRNARRNLIDVDDVANIARWLIAHHDADDIITNIAAPFSLTIPELVGIFEQVLDLRANCDIVDAGGSYAIDTQLALATAPLAGVDFNSFYVRDLIRKYYADHAN